MNVPVVVLISLHFSGASENEISSSFSTVPLAALLLLLVLRPALDDWQRLHHPA